MVSIQQPLAITNIIVSIPLKHMPDCPKLCGYFAPAWRSESYEIWR